jgi:hypothetical protein
LKNSIHRKDGKENKNTPMIHEPLPDLEKAMARMEGMVSNRQEETSQIYFFVSVLRSISSG